MIGGIVGAVMLLLIAAILWFFIRRRRRSQAVMRFFEIPPDPVPIVDSIPGDIEAPQMSNTHPYNDVVIPGSPREQNGSRVSIVPRRKPVPPFDASYLSLSSLPTPNTTPSASLVNLLGSDGPPLPPVPNPARESPTPSLSVQGTSETGAVLEDPFADPNPFDDPPIPVASSSGSSRLSKESSLQAPISPTRVGF